MTVKGVIVAGGEGKRFRPLTFYIQKCMIPVGDMEKPILEYIVRLLQYHKIDEQVLLVGYRHQQIMNYFDHGERFKVKMKYVMDPPDEKGSAAALLNAYRKNVICDNDTLLIYYGDILSNIDLTEMLIQHRKTNAEVTIALAKKFNVNVGVADLDGSRITKFVEKPDIEKPASIGILAIEGTVLGILEEMKKQSNKESFDIMGDVISIMVKRRRNIYGYLTDAQWMDIGSVEKYEKLEENTLREMLGFLFN